MVFGLKEFTIMANAVNAAKNAASRPNIPPTIVAAVEAYIAPAPRATNAIHSVRKVRNNVVFVNIDPNHIMNVNIPQSTRAHPTSAGCSGPRMPIPPNIFKKA